MCQVPFSVVDTGFSFSTKTYSGGLDWKCLHKFARLHSDLGVQNAAG